MRSLDELTAREFLAFSNKYLQLFGLVGYNWHTLVASKIRRVYMLAVAAFLIIEGAINVQKLAIDRAPYRSNFAFLKTIALMLVFGAGTVNAVHTVLASFLHVDQKIEILVTVALVDRQLRTLNATTTYSKKVLKTRIRFVCAFLTFCFVWDFFSLLRYNRKMIISLVIMKYTPRLIVWADMFDFLLYIEVMRQQLRSSNDKLRRLVDESADKCNNYAQDGKITRDVCTLIGIHTMIRKACLTYNNLYGLRLVCIMLTILTKIVLYTYFMIVEDVTYLTLPARTKSPWTLPDLVTYNLYFTGVIVSFFMFIFRLLDQITKTKKQADKSICLVHKLRAEVDSLPLSNFLKAFSNQLYDERIEFNACGCFALDFTLLFKITSKYCTYLVILLQFHFSNLAFKNSPQRNDLVSGNT